MSKTHPEPEFEPAYEPEPEVDVSSASSNESMENTLIAEKVRRATAKKAKPAFEKSAGYVYYASVLPEAYPFPITIGPGERINGSWDTGRQHIVWRCPKELAGRLERHDFFRNGRVIKID